MLTWFRRRSQVRSARRTVNLASSLVQQLESRTLLAATWTVSATGITVNGTDDPESIAVSTDGTNFFVDGVDTTVAILGRDVVTINGRAGDDVLTLDPSLGAGFRGFLNGGDDNDTLVGGAGIDRLRGEAGNDSYWGGAGNDEFILDDNEADTRGFHGGAGADSIRGVLFAPGLNLVLNAGHDVEVVHGTDSDDIINLSASTTGVLVNGNGGADAITGGVAGDDLRGGAGNDTLRGKGGFDKFNGGDDDDAIYADTLEDGGAGFTGGLGSDTLRPENPAAAVDWVLGAAGFEIIIGSSLADIIDASGSADSVNITGGLGADLLIGGTAGDFINGSGGNDTIIGGLGADDLRGGGDDDLLYANNLANDDDGDVDRLYGNAGADTLFGSIADGDILNA